MKYDVAIGKFNFAANGRAIASDAAQGFVKVIGDKNTGNPLCSYHRSCSCRNWINGHQALSKWKSLLKEMPKTIHGHQPTLKSWHEAFADVLGMAIHSPKKNKER